MTKSGARTLLRMLNFLSRKLGDQTEINKSDGSGVLGAGKLFDGRTLHWDDRGFWFVDPMLSIAELGTYYANAYWDSRGKNEGVIKRDITHWIMLNDLVPEFFKLPKTFLNFGAGHGGISHLLWAAGHSVVNVEPSDINSTYDERWKIVKDISEVDANSIDMIYGSHSLEHVQSIDEFHKQMQRVMKENGYVFWEVPNGQCRTNGAQQGKIDIPHTYYFTTGYFNHFYSEVILNDTFNSFCDADTRDWKSKVLPETEGQVIRFLGKMRAVGTDQILEGNK